jgi:hypothetical protein
MLEIYKEWSDTNTEKRGYFSDFFNNHKQKGFKNLLDIGAL